MKMCLCSAGGICRLHLCLGICRCMCMCVYIHTTYVHTCPTKNEILQTSDVSPVIMNVNVNDPSSFAITYSAAEWCSHATV